MREDRKKYNEMIGSVPDNIKRKVIWLNDMTNKIIA